jgi:hypothetical protein
MADEDGSDAGEPSAEERFDLVNLALRFLGHLDWRVVGARVGLTCV